MAEPAGNGGGRRGLLVDWGGVLTTSVLASFEAFCAAERLQRERVRELFRDSDDGRRLLVGLELGTLSEPEFEAALCTLLELDPDRAEGMIDRMFGAMRPDDAMLGAVRAARAAGLRTGLISNSWGHDRYDTELLSMFDGVVISGVEGMRKPDPRVYALGAQRVGLAPRDCVYVDDIPGNLRPARELGMATIHHTDAATTIAELERLLLIRLG